MIRWVVTGPAGAGKSTLSAALAELGAKVIDGDALGHEILARPPVAASIAEAFGPGVVVDGVVDRSALGTIVFSDPAELSRLDALTHPALSALAGERLDALARGGCALAVFEAAVYFRLPTPPAADLVIVVDAAGEQRMARMVASGLSPAAASARLAGQSHLASLWARADLTVHNDGTPNALVATAARLWRERGPDHPSKEKR